ncbi:MAG: GAF domain-containing protein [Anaerolineae bacterium]|nr:GAF domain-containing protein [Anaerolineae bacterium]
MVQNEADRAGEARPSTDTDGEPQGGVSGQTPGAGDRAGTGFDPELRARAERMLRSEQGQRAAEYTFDDILALTHELQVHQIELELQNDELRRTQLDLQLTAERYADLYDFAPVGYLSVNAAGRIAQANLTVAAMLGAGRRDLLDAPLSRYIFADDSARFNYLRHRMAQPHETETLELRLRPADGEPYWARLEIITRRDPVDNALLWQIAVSRIEEQKRAEQLMRGLNDVLEERVIRRTNQLSIANRELLEEIGRRKEAEAALREREETLEMRVRERTAELASLLTVSQEISSTLEMDEIFDIILEQLHRTIHYTSCGVFLQEGELLTLVAYRGPIATADVLQSQTTLDQSPLLQEALERRRPVIVDDMEGGGELPGEWQRRADAFQRTLLNDSRSWMGIPLMAKGRPLGILRLDHRKPGHFTTHHADMASTLANQTAVAIENARLYAQAQNVAAVEERQRLARELHDSVAQTFYSISLSTHAAASQLARDPDRARRHLDHVVELANAGLTEMKALIFDLQAENIRREGLVGALRRQLNAITARNDIRVFEDLGQEPEVPLQVKEAAYGVVREALQNVVRHAGASELTLRLSQSEGRLRVEVQDDGVGFEPARLGRDTMGMRSMLERAAAVGGSVEVLSRPSGGTVVRGEFPAQGATEPER